MKQAAKLVLGITLFALICLTPVFASGTQDKTEAGQEQVTEGPFDPMAKYDPSIVVTAVRELPDTVLFVDGEDIENNIWTRKFIEDLGINLKYDWISNSYEEKLNIAIASNQLPDIIPVGLNILPALVESGVAADLTDLIDKYAIPITIEMFEADNYTGIRQVSTNDRIYALPNCIGAKDMVTYFHVRTDWLDNLGLDVPKTIDDLVEVARAFTEQDPNNTGKDDTIGLATQKSFDLYKTGGMDGFFEGYGAYINGWVDDGKGGLVYGGIQKETRDALQRLAEMYSDGLLDLEFSVKDSAGELIASGNTGLFYGPHWIVFGDANTTVQNDPNAMWKVFPIPSIDDNPARPMANGSVTNAYVVNSNAEHPEAVLKLYNTYVDTMSNWSPNYDVEYNVDKETKYFRYMYPPMQVHWPNKNLTAHREVMGRFDDGKGNSEGMTTDGAFILDSILDYYNNNNRTMWHTWAWSGPDNSAMGVADYYDKNDILLENGFLSAATPTMVEKQSSLSDLRDQVFTKIIMGREDITAFDKFVEDWKALGGDEITAEVNAR